MQAIESQFTLKIVNMGYTCAISRLHDLPLSPITISTCIFTPPANSNQAVTKKKFIIPFCMLSDYLNIMRLPKPIYLYSLPRLLSSHNVNYYLPVTIHIYLFLFTLATQPRKVKCTTLNFLSFQFPANTSFSVNLLSSTRSLSMPSQTLHAQQNLRASTN